MDKIREQLRNPIITAAVGFVVGLIIGLPILGWAVWPVKWVDAEPKFLRDDLKQDYLCMTIDSFLVRQDPAAAVTRFNLLGEDASAQLDAFKPGTCNLNEAEINAFRAVVLGPSVPLPVTTVTPVATEKPAASKNTGLVVGLCLVTLLVGAGLVYLLVFRKRGGSTPESPAAVAHDFSQQATRTDYSAQGQEAPISQFMTTYMIGDDLYDDSFSIDSPTGEFLGECGVGISDTIGVGDPKKVTAFEVWLFDKNDIQTITKVVMSPHAMSDGAIRARLESKGEPIEVEADKRIVLETATLVLEARVVDLNLGGGALPENSYFDRLTLELAVWPKTNA
jgi:hypothetical protein